LQKARAALVAFDHCARGGEAGDQMGLHACLHCKPPDKLSKAPTKSWLMKIAEKLPFLPTYFIDVKPKIAFKTMAMPAIWVFRLTP
jgi:hypothetical protein